MNMKKIFMDSLLDLCEHKTLKKITLKEIVSHSGASTQSFYNHFQDKDDLIYYVFRQTFEGIWQIQEEKGSLEYVTQMYENSYARKKFLTQAIQLESNSNLQWVVYRQTFKYYRRLVIEAIGKENLTPKILYALEFNAQGCAGNYVKWLKGEIDVSPKELASYAIECLPSSVKTLIKI